MNEALILEKLDNLSGEIQSLKSEIQALKEPAPSAQPAQSATASILADLKGKYSDEDLAHLMENLLTSVNDIDAMLCKLKAGSELARNIEPIAKQAYPQVLKFFNELEDQFNIDELTGLLRNFLTNLESLNEGMNLLRMGAELKDEIVPIAQIGYPNIIKFLNSLHEGEFQSEQLGTLLHTLLMNVHTFSDLMNMLKPMTELVKDLQVVLRETDVISNTNVWLDSLQQSSGIFKLAGTTFASIKQINIDDQQAEEISQAIQQLDFTHIKPVTPFGAIKHLRDPQIQEALGAMFMILQTMGACLQAYQKNDSAS